MLIVNVCPTPATLHVSGSTDIEVVNVNFTGDIIRIVSVNIKTVKLKLNFLSIFHPFYFGIFYEKQKRRKLKRKYLSLAVLSEMARCSAQI
jgi:hypothetical protein